MRELSERMRDLSDKVYLVEHAISRRLEYVEIDIKMYEKQIKIANKENVYFDLWQDHLNSLIEEKNFLLEIKVNLD